MSYIGKVELKASDITCDSSRCYNYSPVVQTDISCIKLVPHLSVQSVDC